MNGTTATVSTRSGELTTVSPLYEGAWRDQLAGVEHDFYHSAAYHRFSQEQGEGRAFLAVYREGRRRLVWPYLLRPIEDHEAAGFHDVTSVYGYPGPAGVGGERDPAFLRRGCRAVIGLWRSQGVVSVFTRLHPIIENHRLLPVDSAPKHCGQTVSIDLSRGYEQAAAGYRKTLRHDLNRARQSGLVVERDRGLRHLRSFAALYLETMRRNRAPRSYHFGLAYFQDLFRWMSGGCHLFAALWRERLVAGCVLVEWKDLLHYHFAAADENYLSLQPAKLLLDEATRWASPRGHRAFHLGGGRGGQRDGLFQFKAAFSNRRHEFYVWKAVVQPVVYRELCEIHAQDPALGTHGGGYFPAYRRELPALGL